MNNIIKGIIPKILSDNERKWTTELMDDYINNGKINKQLQKKYNHRDIKIAVKSETSDKCIYCESHVTSIYPGDIEHIIPKSKEPSLTFKWDNLTFCCYSCNNNKKDYYEPTNMLINPYTDNTVDYLLPMGPLLYNLNGNKRAEITIKKIKLNREELINRRKEKLEELQKYVNAYHQENVDSLKEIKKNEIEEFIEKSEFSFTLQFWYKQMV